VTSSVSVYSVIVSTIFPYAAIPDLPPPGTLTP